LAKKRGSSLQHVYPDGLRWQPHQWTSLAEGW